jgi:hypothetical protein
MRKLPIIIFAIALLLAVTPISAEQTVKTVEDNLGFVAQTTADTDYTKSMTFLPPDGVSKILSYEIFLLGDLQASTDVKARIKVGSQLEDCSPSSWTSPNIDTPSYQMVFDCMNLVNSYNVTTFKNIDAGFRTSKIAQNIVARQKITYYNQPKRTISFLGGTEYQFDDSGKVFLQLLDDSKTPITNATCYTNIYYPNTTKYINSSMMSYLEDGIHFFDVAIPNIEGVYIISAYCFIPQNINNTYPDDFECGNSGCNASYWEGNWSLNYSEVTSTENPRGSYHLKVYGFKETGFGESVLDLPFDETSGTTADDVSANDNDGTYLGNPNLTVSAINNTGIKFDGVNDWVRIPQDSDYNVNSTEELMICFGVNTYGNINNGVGILDYDDGSVGYEIVGADDEIRFNTDKSLSGAGELLTTYNFNTAGWHTVCFFVNNSIMMSYVDGAFDNDEIKSQSGTMSPSGINMSIGSMDEGSSDFFDGALDEFCIIIGENLNVSGIAYNYNMTLNCEAGEYYNGNATRYINLTDSVSGNTYWNFWAKAKSFSSDSECYYEYYNGSEWNTILIYDDTDDDNTYRYNSFVIDSYGLSSNSGIRVRVENYTDGMGCFIDDINIIQTVSLNTSIFEMVFGSGELHVSPPVNVTNIAENVWNYSNRTLTDYNQSNILEYLIEINNTLYLVNQSQFDYYNSTMNRLDEIYNLILELNQSISELNVSVNLSEVINLINNLNTSMQDRFDIMENLSYEINNSIYAINNSIFTKLFSIQNDIAQVYTLIGDVNDSVTERIESVETTIINMNSTIMTKLHGIQDEISSVNDTILSINTTTMNELNQIRIDIANINQSIYDILLNISNISVNVSVLQEEILDTLIALWGDRITAVEPVRFGFSGFLPSVNAQETEQGVCLDNTTLQVMKRIDLNTSTANKTYWRAIEVQCTYGCSNNACNPAPIGRIFIVLAIVIFVMAMLYVFYRYH